MSLRSHLERLNKEQKLVRISVEASPDYEIAGILKKLEPKPVLFERVRNSPFRVAGNLFCTKDDFASYFGIPTASLIPMLTTAIAHPASCTEITHTGKPAPCQEVILEKPSLSDLPILRHFAGDGGPYITAGVVLARTTSSGCREICFGSNTA